MSRVDRGKRAQRAGAAAEDTVLRHYEESGHHMVARNWRGHGGEIDLIFRIGAELIFVEVKSSRTGAGASRLRPAQLARIQAAAEEFLGGQPAGLLTPMRIDLATVDGTGRVEVLQNLGV
ncbi:putative endonuclease [Poseidonocella pacifica]|uniref:UPF0102 protein SAMN05421688_3481 n=1 Tax=Poseidonocella pacifica TaxID=871651 RepID=A0A1I0YY76_9RHOB|nr:YraN family protein [Poseidonocella pacifica]SFB18304.1 putative endonuclease [Poseidonocella pacifica]